MKLIKTKSEYNKAMARIEVIFDAKPSTPEFDELEILSLLIESYEDKHEAAFPDPDPIETIKFQMEQKGIAQKDLAEVIGKNRASEILNRRGSLSVSLIRKISDYLNISADILIQPFNKEAF